MRRFLPVFIASFFLSIHIGVILYINSSLLGKFFRSDTISLLFLLGAIGNALFFLFTPKLIRQFGKRLLLFFFLLLTTLSTFFLAFTETASVALVSFITYSSVSFMVYYCLDIFLEELSLDAKTGEIRGVYLTFVSLGLALGPFMFAFLVKEEMLRIVYFTAALLLVVPILLSVFSLKSQTPRAHGSYHHSLQLPFGTWWRTRNVRRVTLARLVLESFYAVMVIYTPIYLHSALGFTWLELGIIFTVMLLPFVLFEWPAGKLADRLWGEKELMSIGFFVTIASLLVMPFLGKVFLAWMIVLFISRVGASLIEVMTESYFFKHVNASDTGLLSIFRLARPVSIILAAAVGTLTLNFFSFEKIFFVLAVVVFFGLKESLVLRDTL